MSSTDPSSATPQCLGSLSPWLVCIFLNHSVQNPKEFNNRFSSLFVRRNNIPIENFSGIAALDADIIVAMPNVLLNRRKLLAHRLRCFKQCLCLCVGQLLVKLSANAGTWKNLTA